MATPKVLLFYGFAPLADPEAIRLWQHTLCDSLGIRGRIIISKNGINAAYDHLKDRPVVTYCTGGIRCEVLTPLMRRRGFQEVYQLDGGIATYGEQCGDLACVSQLVRCDACLARTTLCDVHVTIP